LKVLLSYIIISINSELFITLLFSSLHVANKISLSLSIKDFIASPYCLFSLSASSSDILSTKAISLVNKDITMQGIKQRINNVILTGQGITSINKSDVAGKVALNIPVKISTGRLISTVRPEYRTAYALVRYISSRAFAKNVSSSIDTKLLLFHLTLCYHHFHP